MNISHNHKRFPLIPLIGSTLLALVVGTSAVQADDIEVYRTQESNNTVKPNLLFVLDESSSMSYTDGDSTTRTEELRIALRAIFNTPENGGLENVNAAFMGYSRRQYGGRRVITTGNDTGFFDIDTNRSTLNSRIDDIYYISGTVTVQAMKSSVEWFESGFTDDDGTGSYDGCYTARGNCPSGTGTDGDITVTTPVTEELYCAQSAIILLTDGSPYSDQPSTDSRYSDPHPYKSDGYVYRGNDCTDPDPSSFSMSRAGCTGDIAEWAFENDLHPTIQGGQNVVTHTVGFHTGSDQEAYLQDIANRGGGNYYESSDTASLVAAFEAIANEAGSSVEYTFNAPLVPFNATNTAVTGDFIYVPVFEPSVTAFWKGNLKKYGLSIENSIVTINSASGGGTVLDASSLFTDTAKSYWSTTTDGKAPLIGGAAEKFIGTRNLYTYVAASGSTNLSTSDDNLVTIDNPLITHALLGVTTPADLTDSSDPNNMLRKDLIEWVNWSDDGNAHEGEMGAAIHALPAVVNYGGGDVVLMPTSEGVLEAIDAATGSELWAFMPQAMLANISALKNNLGTTEPIYGLDGPMTIYETNGKTMVVVGMRRGGKNYYALDITNRDAPVFAWQIIGGETANFTNLGQTWSKPQFIKMDISGVPTNKQVLAFGGGYDADTQDGVITRVDDTLGKGIYIVNAETGAWISSITPTGNSNSIAGDILPIDINANGITDRFYAADVGGRILRIDTPDADFTSTSVTSGIVADINAGDTATQYQQFFNTPEVGYFNQGSNKFLAILIGTGNRPNPLSHTITDGFYMIKDPNVFQAPETYVTVSRDDLLNTTSNLVQTGTSIQINDQLALLSSKKGWYIDMPVAGEKIFSKASLYDFGVLFTSYSGTRTGNDSPCTAGATTGESNFWAINLLTGGAVYAELGGDNNVLNTSDRSKSLNIPGMPPSPTLVFPGTDSGPGEEVIAMVGLQKVTQWPDRFHAIYWEEALGQ